MSAAVLESRDAGELAPSLAPGPEQSALALPIGPFHVESRLTLPCTAPGPVPADHGPSPSRLQIRLAPGSLAEIAPRRWLGQRGTMLRSYAIEGGVLMCIGRGLRMSVIEPADCITLDCDPSEAHDPALAAACCVNLGLSVCCLLACGAPTAAAADQRAGFIPLHAAAVELDGALIAISAPSGTGKSTLLWALIDQGARFATDDMLPLEVSGDEVIGWPSISLHAKFSEAALRERGVDPEELQEVVPGWGEYWVQVQQRERLLGPRPLRGIFVLKPFDQPELPGRLTITRSGAGMALGELIDNTQGLWGVAGILDGRKMRVSYEAIAERVPIYTLEYHRRRDGILSLIAAMREVVAGKARFA